MAEQTALLLQRSVSDPAGGQSFGDSSLNILAIVMLAVFISYLALRLARRGGKGGRRK